MTAHTLETNLAREFCTKAIPCEDCIVAARLVLANQAAVLRLLRRLETHPPVEHPHGLHLPHLGRPS